MSDLMQLLLSPFCLTFPLLFQSPCLPPPAPLSSLPHSTFLSLTFPCKTSKAASIHAKENDTAQDIRVDFQKMQYNQIYFK